MNKTHSHELLILILCLPLSVGAMTSAIDKKKQYQNRQLAFIESHEYSTNLQKSLAKVCIAGTPEEAEALLNRGAFVNDDSFGESLLLLAAKCGNTEVIKTLIKRGAKGSQWDILINSLRGLHVSTLRALTPNPAILKKNRNVNLILELFCENMEQNKIGYGWGSVPLKEDLFPCLDILKQKGAYKNGLHGVINTLRRPKVLQALALLLEWGADPNERDEEGNTPLFMGVESATLESLLHTNASLCALNNDNQTIIDHFFSAYVAPWIEHGQASEILEKQYFEALQTLLGYGLFFKRVPSFGRWTLVFRRGWHTTLTGMSIPGPVRAREVILDAAPMSYAFFIPSDEELIASRARLAEILVGLRLAFKKNLPYVAGWILASDIAGHPGAEDSYHRRDLVNIFLDQLRWGNPGNIHMLMQVKKDLIDHLAEQLFTEYTNFCEQHDGGVQETPDSLERLKKNLRELVQKGIDERLTGLKNFGRSHSVKDVTQLKAFLTAVYPEKSQDWRDYVLRVHSIKDSIAQSLQSTGTQSSSSSATSSTASE